MVCHMSTGQSVGGGKAEGKQGVSAGKAGGKPMQKRVSRLCASELVIVFVALTPPRSQLPDQTAPLPIPGETIACLSQTGNGFLLELEFCVPGAPRDSTHSSVRSDMATQGHPCLGGAGGHGARLRAPRPVAGHCRAELSQNFRELPAPGEAV